jgi:hypothetical protein
VERAHHPMMSGEEIEKETIYLPTASLHSMLKLVKESGIIRRSITMFGIMIFLVPQILYKSKRVEN